MPFAEDRSRVPRRGYQFTQQRTPLAQRVNLVRRDVGHDLSVLSRQVVAPYSDPRLADRLHFQILVTKRN